MDNEVHTEYWKIVRTDWRGNRQNNGWMAMISANELTICGRKESTGYSRAVTPIILSHH